MILDFSVSIGWIIAFSKAPQMNPEYNEAFTLKSDC